MWSLLQYCLLKEILDAGQLFVGILNSFIICRYPFFLSWFLSLILTKNTSVWLINVCLWCHIPVMSPPAIAIISVTPTARSWYPACSPADLPSPGMKEDVPELSWIWLLFSVGARAGNCWYRLGPYWDSDAMPAISAPTTPASTPGMPWRLWTPQVSCTFRFLSRNGCQFTGSKKQMFHLIYIASLPDWWKETMHTWKLLFYSASPPNVVIV